MKKILDIKITRNRRKRTFRINQSHYLFELLDELHMIIDKHESTKISMNEYDAFRFIESNDTRINSIDYQHKCYVQNFTKSTHTHWLI